MASFVFSLKSDESDAHSLSMDNLKIIGNEGTVSSEESRRYLMMIFLSITFLLDGLREFLLTKKSRKYDFGGVDGSFQVTFLRKYSAIIVIQVFGQVISRENKTQFVQELWHSTKEFVGCYRGEFRDTDVGVKDLDESMKDFSEAFADILMN